MHQTSETAQKDYLKTRWYKASYDKTKTAIIDLLGEYGLIPEASDDEYGEIFVKSKQFDLIITIFEFGNMETSVDLSLDSKMVFDLGKSKRIINDFYNDLAKKIEFKGVSLHI